MRARNVSTEHGVTGDLFAFANLTAPTSAALDLRFADLVRGSPLWPVSPGRWREIVDGVRRFADGWHHAATAAAWTAEQLYGLSRQAPYARLDVMGAAWIVAARRDQVISVDRSAITLKTRSSATLQVYRAMNGHPTPFHGACFS